jgi:hypothetical protein
LPDLHWQIKNCRNAGGRLSASGVTHIPAIVSKSTGISFPFLFSPRRFQISFVYSLLQNFEQQAFYLSFAGWQPNTLLLQDGKYY